MLNILILITVQIIDKDNSLVSQNCFNRHCFIILQYYNDELEYLLQFY